MGLTHDDFIRTTSDATSRAYRRCGRKIRDNGFIYKGTYTGQYLRLRRALHRRYRPGDPCPDCGRPTETVSEENYYFKLSAFQDS